MPRDQLKYSKKTIDKRAMKDLSNCECLEIFGGGSVFKWFGKVYAHIQNTYDRHIEDIYQKVMIEGEIIPD